MKLLFENWRQYLSDDPAEEVIDALVAKRTIKIIKAYRYDNGQDDPNNSPDAPSIDTQHREFKNYLLDHIPSDLTDNELGTSVLWLLKLSREDPKVAAAFINGRTSFADTGRRRSTTRHALETFFHHQRFMPRQDLMQIKTMEDLDDMTDAAKEEIQKAQDKKNYHDAEQGTEIFRDDNKWTIAALHNKGAACELGKNTEWCTAAPGLDYFEDYYKEDDPLFYFAAKEPDLDGMVSAKYQFHYGTSQFMDSKDDRVDKETFEVLHDMLIQTKAYDKYEKLRIFDLERMVKMRLVEGPGSQQLINEMREILNSLKDPYAMANSLADMATMEHMSIPTYVLRWLASEEFYKYTGVGLRIVRYHQIVPSDILQDIADNNPQQRTRDAAKAVLKMRKGPEYWDYKGT